MTAIIAITGAPSLVSVPFMYITEVSQLRLNLTTFLHFTISVKHCDIVTLFRNSLYKVLKFFPLIRVFPSVSRLSLGLLGSFTRKKKKTFTSPHSPGNFIPQYEKKDVFVQLSSYRPHCDLSRTNHEIICVCGRSSSIKEKKVRCEGQLQWCFKCSTKNLSQIHLQNRTTQSVIFLYPFKANGPFLYHLKRTENRKPLARDQ